MELTINQALQQGISAHRGRQTAGCGTYLSCNIASAANHPDANHNLGVLAVTVGKPLEAIPLFKLALEANPQTEQFWLSYIDALIKTEKADVARRVLSDAYQAGNCFTEKLQAAEEQLGFELAASSHEHLSRLIIQSDLLEVSFQQQSIYVKLEVWGSSKLLHKFIKHDPANAEALSLLSQLLLLDKKEGRSGKNAHGCSIDRPRTPLRLPKSSKVITKSV